MERGLLWRSERDVATFLPPKDLHRPVGAEEAGEEEVVLPEERREKEAVVHQATRQEVAGPHRVVVVGPLRVGADGHLGADGGPRVEVAVVPQGLLGLNTPSATFHVAPGTWEVHLQVLPGTLQVPPGRCDKATCRSTYQVPAGDLPGPPPT